MKVKWTPGTLTTVVVRTPENNFFFSQFDRNAATIFQPGTFLRKQTFILK